LRHTIFVFNTIIVFNQPCVLSSSVFFSTVLLFLIISWVQSHISKQF
jgi:hypothetical protein